MKLFWSLLVAVAVLCPIARAQSEAEVFELPSPQGPGARSTVQLSGTWEIARYDDPDPDTNRFEAVQELPAEGELEWMSAQVPGSVRGMEGMEGCHRFIYRTRVRVPAAARDRGFSLHFAGTNWIVGVFVNGEFAGDHTSVWIPWDMDISDHVRPGEVNELAIAVKSPWYGWDTEVQSPLGEEGPGTLKAFWDKNSLGRPSLVPYGGKGDGNGNNYGIVNPVYLHCVGNAYTQEVFVKPSVAQKRLETEVTVRNTADRERTFHVRCEAVNDATDAVEKTFEPVEVTVPANDTATTTVAGPWEDPRLWWPEPDPDLYRLRTSIHEGDRQVDVHEQLFGFREVTIDGTSVKLNGKRYDMWGWWGLSGRIENADQYAEQLREERTRFNRFFSHTALRSYLPAQEDRLEYYDRHGITGAAASMIEGMGVHYVLSYLVDDPETGGKKLVLNEPVWRNFRRHMAQIARAYRNHPSVLMYSLENETVYINAANFYGWVAYTGISYDDYMNLHEEAMANVAHAAQEYDDTRPYIVSGAGDLNGRLPIICWHYPRGSVDWYPENAYTVEKLAQKVERWPWKRQKPVWIPESTFADDLNLGTYAIGDRAFASQYDAERGKAIFQRMLFGGYRWAGIGWSCCGNYAEFPEVQDMLSALCVVPRKQTHRLYGGRQNELLFKVMNDTFSEEPVTFEWTYEVAGRRVAGERVALDIEPGFGQEYTIAIEAPQTEQRLDGTLTLKVTQPDAEPYVEERSVPVLPTVERLAVDLPVTVLDRSDKLADYLDGTGLDFRRIESLEDLRNPNGLLLIGPDTLTAEEAYGPELKTAASGGLRIVVLEQDNPPAGAGLPVPISTTEHYGGYAHPQALGTPVFRDLGAHDLIDWAGGFPTYKNVYRKPSRGARSLAHCGPQLPYSALLEVPCGKGFIVLSQLRIGDKLGVDPGADILLRNLAEHYAGARPSTAVAAVFAPDDRLLRENLEATGVLLEEVERLRDALDPERFGAAVVDATTENLRLLNAMVPQVEAFQDAGGWVMLCGLRPDGLGDFNALLGQDRMIRPFRLERVTFEGRGHPLGSTLGNPDVGLISNQHIQHGRMWPSQHTFNFVVDGRDIAPFCRVPGGPEDPFEYEPTRDDKDPYNFVNGLLNRLSWRCIRQIWWEGPEPKDLKFHLRRPDRVSVVRVWNNANYSTIKDMDVIFDGDEASAVSVELPDGSGLKEIELPRPRRVQESITLRLKSKREGRNPNLVGIENVQFLRPAAPEGAAYLDSVGGLVAFPRGEGGFFLNQVKFMEEEPNAENAGKKRNLVGVLLQNMGVGISSKVALPGVNVSYEPVDLMQYCNQYMDSSWVKENVWFGQPEKDLSALETREGEVELADVDYQLVHFQTAPKQDCIMLGASEAPRQFPTAVRGIPVGRKCDMLFFLQAANVTEPITAEERERMTARRRPFRLPRVMEYVLHYTDGETETVPVVLEKHVDHWLQEEARALEGARPAWTHRFPDGQYGVLYSMEIPNPRPSVTVDSLDVVLATDEEGNPIDRAVPAVLAVTTGRVVGSD
ncbi:MAG: glycoside hydrolase family 2 TIM barrel-domain containing protein [Candidatus Brocadiia bacterium]